MLALLFTIIAVCNACQREAIDIAASVVYKCQPDLVCFDNALKLSAKISSDKDFDVILLEPPEYRNWLDGRSYTVKLQRRGVKSCRLNVIIDRNILDEYYLIVSTDLNSTLVLHDESICRTPTTKEYNPTQRGTLENIGIFIVGITCIGLLVCFLSVHSMIG